MTNCPKCPGRVFVQRIHTTNHLNDTGCLVGKHLHLECLTCSTKFVTEQAA